MRKYWLEPELRWWDSKQTEAIKLYVVLKLIFTTVNLWLVFDKTWKNLLTYSTSSHLIHSGSAARHAVAPCARRFPSASSTDFQCLYHDPCPTLLATSSSLQIFYLPRQLQKITFECLCRKAFQLYARESFEFD
jgi:hypothetical protein